MERRKYQRYSTILKATLENGATEEFSPCRLARVKNISRGGVALHAGERFAVDTVLTITLHTGTGDIGPLDVEVLHVAEQDNGSWLMGAKLRTELSGDMIAVLVRDALLEETNVACMRENQLRRC